MKRFLLRFALFSFLWWVLTEGVLDDLALAFLSILGATGVSIRLLPGVPLRVRPLGLLRFLLYFIKESIRGGLEVARRALDPRLPLAPGLVHYTIGLESLPVRVLFIWTVSLLPGIASVDVQERTLTAHALDASDAEAVLGSLRELEAKISSMFTPAAVP